MKTLNKILKSLVGAVPSNYRSLFNCKLPHPLKDAIHLFIILPVFAGCFEDRNETLYKTWALTFKDIHFQSGGNK